MVKVIINVSSAPKVCGGIFRNGVCVAADINVAVSISRRVGASVSIKLFVLGDKEDDFRAEIFKAFGNGKGVRKIYLRFIYSLFSCNAQCAGIGTAVSGADGNCDSGKGLRRVIRKGRGSLEHDGKSSVFRVGKNVPSPKGDF